MTRFQGKTILTTGASSGIGRATALWLAREGARVVLIARDRGRLAECAAELPGEGHEAISCDVTQEDAVVAMADAVRERVGPVAGLVHCAGVHWLRPLQVTDAGALQEMLASHVVSAVALTRALVSRRLAAKEGCSVVWLSSVAALQGSGATIAYAAAKGALLSAGRAAAVELARRRIRVNVIVPGVVRTPLSDAFLGALAPEQAQAIADRHLLGVGEPEDVAGVAAFLLSDDARWITGTAIVADGGLTAH